MAYAVHNHSPSTNSTNENHEPHTTRRISLCDARSLREGRTQPARDGSLLAPDPLHRVCRLAVGPTAVQGAERWPTAKCACGHSSDRTDSSRLNAVLVSPLPVVY